VTAPMEHLFMHRLWASADVRGPVTETRQLLNLHLARLLPPAACSVCFVMLVPCAAAQVCPAAEPAGCCWSDTRRRCCCSCTMLTVRSQAVGRV
jgi:hypothetical protein